jgi:type II secretory ATPase GspE/PulE/Tfp pilus assembly ATPase PilB-like protein
MGVDPYLIAPTLQLALAQRLVRRICPNSGRKVEVSGSIKELIEHEFRDLPEKHHNVIPKMDHVLFAEPSPGCASGTKGRVAVMEAIEINGAIQDLILKGSNEDEILTAARRNGFISMKEDAIIKALEHAIPFEEISTLGGDLLISDEAEKEADELKKQPSSTETENDLDKNELPVATPPVDKPQTFTV